MRITLLAFAVAALVLLSPNAAAGGWYVGTYGGINFDDVINHPAVDNDAGMVIGGTVGTGIKAVPGLRLEFDASFRQNETTVAFGPGLTVDHDTFALMANLAYDVDMGMIKPYVLVGAGYANTEATVENIALARLERSGVAWQGGVGVHAAVEDGVTMGLGYRFLQAPDLTVFSTELSSGQNHSVIAEAKFAFD